MFLIRSLSTAIFFVLVYSPVKAESLTPEHQKWLKDKFAVQHENLIPIVAVADMYFACNNERKFEPNAITVKDLVTKLDKNELAEKLAGCLKKDTPNSNIALNFGLIGCFHEQLKGLPEKERTIKEKLVKQAIAKLSKEQRQQSFTQCVTDQAIGYLK